MIKDAPLLELKNLSFSYLKKGKNMVLKNLNLKLFPNQHLTILGHNGSGKTTLGKIIAGLETNYQGELHLFQQKFTRHKAWTAQNYQQVGLIFQNPESQFIGLTVENDLAFGLENLAIPPQTILEKIKATVRQFALEPIFNEQANNLSDGNKQKVAIAAVLIQEPKLVIFDEPTSMVDQKSEKEINRIITQIKAKKISVIEITHNIERLLVADQVMLLENGVVKYLGSAKTLLQEKIHLLNECSGLQSPFFYRLLQQLREKGIAFQDTLNEELLIKQIWIKLSK